MPVRLARIKKSATRALGEAAKQRVCVAVGTGPPGRSPDDAGPSPVRSPHSTPSSPFSKWPWRASPTMWKRTHLRLLAHTGDWLNNAALLGTRQPLALNPVSSLGDSLQPPQKRTLQPVRQELPNLLLLDDLPDRPLRAPKENWPGITIYLLFCLVWGPCACSLLSVEVFPFAQLLAATLCPGDWMLPDSQSSNKARNICKYYPVEFCFLTGHAYKRAWCSCQKQNEASLYKLIQNDFQDKPCTKEHVLSDILRMRNEGI